MHGAAGGGAGDGQISRVAKQLGAALPPFVGFPGLRYHGATPLHGLFWSDQQTGSGPGARAADIVQHNPLAKEPLIWVSLPRILHNF